MKAQLILGEVVCLNGSRLEYQYFGSFFRLLNRLITISGYVNAEGNVRFPIWATALIQLCWILNLPFRLLRISGRRHKVFFDRHHVLIGRGYLKHYFEERLVNKIQFKGSTPLQIDKSRGRIFFGEYETSSQNNEVSVWSYDCSKRELQRLACLNTVRHIHSVLVFDDKEGLLVATGDSNEQCKLLWVPLSSSENKLIAEGSQVFRAVGTARFGDGFVYGTDDPSGPNFILQAGGVELPNISVKLASVGINSPIYYCQKYKDEVFFSSAVENHSHRINQKVVSTVFKWSSNPSIQVLVNLKKDWLPFFSFPIWYSKVCP